MCCALEFLKRKGSKRTVYQSLTNRELRYARSNIYFRYFHRACSSLGRAVVVLSATAKPPSWRTVDYVRECLLPLFLCFIGYFTAYRLDQFIEEVLVNGLSFKITLFGLAQFSSDNFGRHFSHSEQEHVCKKAVGKDK